MAKTENNNKEQKFLRLDFANVIEEARLKALETMDEDVPKAIIEARDKAKKGALIIHNHKILF